MTLGDRVSRTVCAVVMAGALPVLAAGQGGGWIKSGSSPNDYETGVDGKSAFTGASSGYIRSAVPKPGTFGTYMQIIDATQYRGKRVRMSAQVKTENVEDWSGLWLRVDAAGRGVAFDNMQGRPIKGTTAWTPVSIVLDVAPQANALAFGILLAGRGAAWVDDLTFDVVGDDVPVTDLLKAGPSQPRNLDFENPAPAR